MVLAIGALSGVAYILTIAADAPDINSLKPVDEGVVSQVYAADGRRLGFIDSTDLRTPISDGQIPVVAKRATVAMKDQRFYHHGGVDPEGIVRAAFRNIGSGKTLQGGSTIRRQLVRNLYISATGAPPSRGKSKEAKLAEELETKHSKRLDPRHLPELESVRHGRRAERGRPPGGLAPVFDKPAQQLDASTRRRCWPGSRRPPRDYNPFLEPSWRERAATTCYNEMIKAEDGPGDRGREARCSTPLGVSAELVLHDQARELLLRLRQAGARSTATAPTPCARAG